jgi:hypothetical protein
LSIVVSDTSPIRALAHLGNLDLLPKMFGEVLIPPAVAGELEKPRPRFEPISIQGLAFARIRAPQNQEITAELLAILGTEARPLSQDIRRSDRLLP